MCLKTKEDIFKEEEYFNILNPYRPYPIDSMECYWKSPKRNTYIQYYIH